MTGEEFRWLCHNDVGGQRTKRRPGVIASLALVATAMTLGLAFGGGWNGLVERVQSRRCALENNFLVMEATRPITDCNMCRNVTGALVLVNATRQRFERHAYSGRPIVVRGATAKWAALDVFSFGFFKQLYTDVPNAFESTESECQFFPFRTEFLTLRDVFDMGDDRAALKEGTEPWYIGWSNCNPDVADVLRQHYSRPDFLPADSESSAIDWIFMGGSGPGASLHLDYVHRPSWQAQISGRKIWHLTPPPECEAECQSFDVAVNKGDIVFIDTNQWYHNTFIVSGEISITIGSEYD